MQLLQKTLSDILVALYGDGARVFDISPVPDPKLGEYCIGVFALAKQLGRNPTLLAREITQELIWRSDIFVSADSVGGYVNFFLTDVVWWDIFLSLSDAEPRRIENPETMVVDYIGANIGKPLHIGHLCTPSIGQSLINIYRYLDYTVIGDTHVGDWWLFGKLIAAHKLYGRADGLSTAWVEYLLELYIEVTRQCEADESIEEYCREEFKKLSQGDPENMRLWGEFTCVSLDAMNRILALIHVVPDYDIGESFYEDLPLPKLGNQPPLRYNMNTIVSELLEKWIATKNEDGSVGVVFPLDTKLPSVVIQKKNGTNLYITSDLCAIKYRITNGWNPKKIIYSVDIRQQLHFRQCFEISRMAGWWEGVEFFHAGNGHISLSDGAMSTRRGNIIRLDDLVSEAFERTQKILEEKWRTWSHSIWEEDIREIAVGALKYSYLMQDRERDVVFSWDKALCFDGNSGPYIQYAYVRALKIVQESEILYHQKSPSEFSIHDKFLIQKLAEFEGKISLAAQKYKPHILALYAYDLAVVFNSYYVHTPKVLDESDISVKHFRLALIAKTAQILKKSFELLAIQMPKEM